MDKYKKTAGLNYLSENSYKGDGSPGMVMGIASDARGDTNTNEAQKPTTSSKHSSRKRQKEHTIQHTVTQNQKGAILKYVIYVKVKVVSLVVIQVKRLLRDVMTLRSMKH